MYRYLQGLRLKSSGNSKHPASPLLSSDVPDELDVTVDELDGKLMFWAAAITNRTNIGTESAVSTLKDSEKTRKRKSLPKGTKAHDELEDEQPQKKRTKADTAADMVDVSTWVFHLQFMRTTDLYCLSSAPSSSLRWYQRELKHWPMLAACQ